MLTMEYLLQNNNDIDRLAWELSGEDMGALVGLLQEKNDEIRYTAFLVLQKRSETSPDVYPFWEDFVQLLNSENSYHRSIGIMLISANVKWDESLKLDTMITKYLSLCDDEKFITARQSILSIKKWAQLKPQLVDELAQGLMKINVLKRKDSQRKLLLMDILLVLFELNSLKHSSDIMQYAINAASGGVLDNKHIRIVEKMYLS